MILDIFIIFCPSVLIMASKQKRFSLFNGNEIKYIVPHWEIAEKLKPVYTNPHSNLRRGDLQALWFSARQDPYNLEQYQLWIDYAFEHFPPYCYKANSDAPSLMQAVSNEQKMVIDFKIRTYSNELSLAIPKAINYVVYQFYIQPAIYPVPHKNMYLSAYSGPTLPVNEPSWRIHPEESLADPEHPANIQDKINYETAREKLITDPTLKEVRYNKAGKITIREE